MTMHTTRGLRRAPKLVPLHEAIESLREEGLPWAYSAGSGRAILVKPPRRRGGRVAAQWEEWSLEVGPWADTFAAWRRNASASGIAATKPAVPSIANLGLLGLV